VRRALRSARFSRLLDSWAELVASPPKSDPEPRNASRPIGDVASERILKAYRRIVKRGRNLGDDPPPEMLHRIRIDGKKLRYLLEFFASLFPADDVAVLVGHLKGLQDNLGEFNDLCIQHEHLKTYLKDVVPDSQDPPTSAAAIGGLIALLNTRQIQVRMEFARTFTKFSRRRNADLFNRLFGCEGDRA